MNNKNNNNEKNAKQPAKQKFHKNIKTSTSECVCRNNKETERKKKKHVYIVNNKTKLVRKGETNKLKLATNKKTEEKMTKK